MPTTATAVVAVDGPSGSGKSSVSRGVARALGLRYLDTGAMYRAITWAVLRDGGDVHDPDAVAAAARSRPARPGRPIQTSRSMEVDGTDVSRVIREDVVTRSVSAVAAEPRTRAVLVEQQRGRSPRPARPVRGSSSRAATSARWSCPTPTSRCGWWPTRRSGPPDGRRRTPRRAGCPQPAQAAPGGRDRGARSSRGETRWTPVAPPRRRRRPTDAVVVDATHLGLAEVIDVVVGLVRDRTRP